MATFYLLPPRVILGQRLVAALGLQLTDRQTCAELAEALGAAVERSGALVVYRDDVPPHEDLFQVLKDGFGADDGDEVIELAFGEASRRRWQIAA